MSSSRFAEERTAYCFCGSIRPAIREETSGSKPFAPALTLLAPVYVRTNVGGIVSRCLASQCRPAPFLPKFTTWRVS